MDAWVGEEADPLSLHKYLYTGSDPINHVDPSGHFFSLGEVGAATNIQSTISGSQIDIGLNLLDVALDPQGAGQNFTQNSVLAAGVLALGGSGAKILKMLSQKANKLCRGIKVTCYKALVGRINTPYGIAEQLDSPHAWATLKRVQNGAPVYRLGKIGKSNTGDAQFWSPKDPRNMSPKEFSSAFGIPKENTNFDFFIVGRLKPGALAVTRPAPGAGVNAGGGLEVVTTPNSVIIDAFSML